MQPYTVQKGDTLNAISQKYGYANYKDAGLTAKSGNPDMIYPGETFNISQNPAKNAYINNTANPNANKIADITSQDNKLNEPPSQQSVADTSYSNYLNSLQQPQDTTEATNYLNSLTTQSKLDQEKALNTGESMAFATGEAQRVSRNNAIYTDAAASKLQTLISRDASKTTIAKARAEYEQAKLKAEKDAVGAQFELSPGQVRYDANGKVVASLPADTSDQAYKDAQIRNINSQISERNQAKIDTTQFTIPKASRNLIMGYGYKPADVDALQADIRQYGLTKTLEGIPADMQMVIQKILDTSNLTYLQ